jgi:acyl carrier protein
MSLDESMESCVTRLVLEYAQSIPAARPLDLGLSLRKDLAIESLSLVSLTLRLGDELGVDVVELGLELGKLETLGDLIKVGHTISGFKGATNLNEG